MHPGGLILFLSFIHPSRSIRQWKRKIDSRKDKPRPPLRGVRRPLTCTEYLPGIDGGHFRIVLVVTVQGCAISL